MHRTGTLKVTTPTDREIAMTRVFNAPRPLVFDAITKPELLKRWFDGPPGWTLTVCEIDLRVDANHCGACDHACADGLSCQQGACV